MTYVGQALGSACGTYNSAQMRHQPTLEEATEALRKAYKDIELTWGDAEVASDPEVKAHRASLLMEAGGKLTSAIYDYQRAAFDAAKPKR